MKKAISLSFCIFSTLWLVLAYYFSNVIQNQSLGFVFICTAVLGMPIFFAGMYSTSIRKIQLSEIFHQQGILHWLVTGRLLALLIWTCWSLFSVFFILFYLSTASKVEWSLLFCSLPVFILIYWLNSTLISRELKAYITVHLSLVSSRVIFALLMALIYILLLMWVGETAPAQGTEPLSNIETMQASSSMLVTETIRLLSHLEELKQNALIHIFTINGSIYSLIVFLGSSVFFANIALVFSSFILPAKEYRRIFSPLKNIEIPPALTLRSLSGNIAVIAFSLGFVCLPLTAYLELWLKSNPEIVEEIHLKEDLIVETTIEFLEKIGEEYYQLGTIEEISQVKVDILKELDLSMADIQEQSDLGYQLMTDNVDNYLDWYYSLVGEYSRIYALLDGDLETMMATQLQEQLMQGDAFATMEKSIALTLDQNEQLNKVYLSSVEKILLSNKVEPESDKVEVQETLSMVSLLAPPSHTGIQNLQARLAVSGAAGAAITGIIAAKVAAKVVSKGTIKLGAKALAKVAVGKASSALGGGALGAVAGSVIPGLGTVVGGVIGGIVGGLVVGLSVEQLLIMLEEAYSRDEFKAEIVDSIEAARLEFQESLQN